MLIFPLLFFRRFGFVLDMLSWLFVLVAVGAAMGARGSMDAGKLGLSLLYTTKKKPKKTTG